MNMTSDTKQLQRDDQPAKIRVVPHSESSTAPRTSLEQYYYTSLEWHQRDLELVFKTRWLFVGHASQMPNHGDFITFNIGKESVVIARQKAELHAFYNTCRHRGTRLCSQPSGNVKAFTCPNHAWTYGLDGSLKIAPRATDIDKSQLSAVPVALEEWNGMLFINLAKSQPTSVAEYLSATNLGRYALERTKVVQDKTYLLNSNWKLAGETYNECYHCGHTHPALVALVDPLKDLEAWDDTSTANDFAMYSDDMREAIIKPGTRTFSMDGQLVCQKPLGADGAWHDEIAALSWFPNFGIFVYPDHAVTYSWIPVGPDQTAFRSTWLVHEDAVEGADYDLAKLVALGDITNIEDKAVCENAQKGIETSGYIPGPLHPVFEGPLRGFNKVYLDYVGTKKEGEQS